MIPKFDTYYTNLHSSFIVCDKFLTYLENEYLNGFVLIEGNNKKAYRFMFEGETRSCLLTTKTGYKKITPAEFSSLLEKDSFVSTCQCLPEQIDFFSQAHTAKPIYKIAAKDNISPEKLMLQCKKRKITGYLKTQNNIAKNKTYIYFDKGNMMGSMNLNNKDYYFEKTSDKNSIQKKLLKTDIYLYQLSPEIRDQTKDMQSLSNCFEEIFNLLETQSKSKDFSSVWRKCALDLSDIFVFLDPFAGEFNYKNRKIKIWKDININTAIHGIDELVHIKTKKTNTSDNDIKTVKNKYLNLFGAYEIRQ